MPRGLTQLGGELGALRPAPGKEGSRQPGPEADGIARDSPIPYHYQLFKILRDAINGGVWCTGETIPSEAELARTYGISRTVIRSALHRLTEEGLVERSRGRRSVVRQPQFGYEAVLGESAWPYSIAGSAYPGRVIDSTLVSCGDEVAAALAIPSEQEVFRLTCVHRGEGMPNSLTRIFLRVDATPLLRERAQSRRALEVEPGGPPLPVQLETRYHLRLCRSEARVEAKACDDFEAGALDIRPGQPVFGISTFSYSPDDACVSFAQIVFCTKRAAFNFTIRHHRRSPSLAE